MTSRFRLFVSVLLVVFLLTSMMAPVAADEPLPLVIVAAPAIPLIADGAVVLGGAAIGAIAALIGHMLKESINSEDVASGVEKELNALFAAKKWVDATSKEREAITLFETALYADGGSKKPDKDEDKWYHEAKREDNKVKVNTERLSEKEAAQKAKDGKDIFTVNEKLGKKVAERVIRDSVEGKGLSPKEIEREIGRLLSKIKKPEIHEGGKEGYYPHYHLEMSGKRIHIWWDKAP